MAKRSPFKYFKTGPEIFRLAEMLYVRFPLSLRNIEDLLHERSIDVSHETVRFWWYRFGPVARFLVCRVERRRPVEFGFQRTVSALIDGDKAKKGLCCSA